MNKFDSLVVRKQVIKFILERINLPEATVREIGVDSGDLGQLHLNLGLGLVIVGSGGIGTFARSVDDSFSGVTFTLWLIGVVFLLIVIVVVVVSRGARLHDSVEALEALHDVVHVYVKLIRLIIIRGRRGGSSPKISGVTLV